MSSEMRKGFVDELSICLWRVKIWGWKTGYLFFSKSPEAPFGWFLFKWHFGDRRDSPAELNGVLMVLHGF